MNFSLLITVAAFLPAWAHGSRFGLLRVGGERLGAAESLQPPTQQASSLQQSSTRSLFDEDFEM